LALGGPLRADVTGEAAFLTDLALRESPVIQQAARRADQARARLEETGGFFDPRLTGAAGASRWVRGIPGSSASFLFPDNAAAVQAAVDVPLPPGAYVSAGAAERYYRRTGDGLDPYYQTLLGVQLRVPLWRDFGFRQWRRDRDAAELEAAAAEAAWRAACQDLRHRVELAHVAAREALAGRWVAAESTRRAEALLAEAEELVRRQAIPVYQVYPARMELDLRRQDAMEADRVWDAARRDLAALLGGREDWTLSDREDDLPALAAAGMDLPRIEPGEALAARGSYVELALRVRAAEALLEKLRDDLSADVSLNAGATYQGENETGPWGDQRLVSQDPLGGEVALVVRRAWGLRAERARLARQAAVIGEWQARLREEQVQIERGRQVAYTAFLSAKEELAVLERAVGSARETLEAEQERFRLGEGRSRNVLDAQKDLTAVLHRRNRAAASLLRAGSDYRHAGGYAGDAAARTAGKGP
jgi:outer membrane protein TolC